MPYFWQVAVHATVMGFIFYAWARHVRLPSGRARRRLLALLLVLPLLTAAVPGRSGAEFAEGVAWLNSARILAIPLAAGITIGHLVLVAAALTTAATIWQELALAMRRPRGSPAGPGDPVVRIVRERAAWPGCDVAISATPSIQVATSGWPSRPRLVISRGAMDALSEDELALVVAHERAHWENGRWGRLHALFLARLLQCYHPVALWVFREYCLEVEVECDAAAGADGRPLARVLLRVYDETDRRDTAARAVLRKRIDVLMAGGPQDAALPAPAVAAAAALMGILLPWIV
jgi:hypothetical protein